MSQVSRNMQKIEEDKDTSIPEDNVTLLSRLQGSGAGACQFLNTHYWILCILIGATALGFNLYRLGSPSLWFDEILSVERARQSLVVLWQIIFATQPNMALYYIFLHFWLGLASLVTLTSTEYVVRLPSAIFAALSSVMVFLLGRRFLGLGVGLVAASIYLLNNLQLVYAQETRSYALQLLLICITWYALFAILTTESRLTRWWVCYTLVTIIAIYTHLFSSLILAAQVCAFAGLMILPGPWRTKIRQQLRNFIAALVSIVVLIIPLLYASRHGSKTGWLPIPHLSDIYHLFLTISAGSKLYLLFIAASCLTGLAVVVLAYQPTGRYLLRKVPFIERVDDKRLAQLLWLLPVVFALVCWLIVPIVLSYIISLGSTRLFSSRYLVTIVPPLVLLVGVSIVVLRWRVVQVVLALVLIFFALQQVPLYYKGAQVEDWKSSSFWLEQHYQANDGLVCYDNAQGCQVSIEYYLRTYPSAAHFTPDSPGTFPWVTYDLTDHLGNSSPAVDPRALATFGTHHPRIFFIVGRATSSAKVRAAQRWLDSHYHFIDRIVTRTVTIRLYTTSVGAFNDFIHPAEKTPR